MGGYSGPVRIGFEEELVVIDTCAVGLGLVVVEAGQPSFEREEGAAVAASSSSSSSKAAAKQPYERNVTDYRDVIESGIRRRKTKQKIRRRGGGVWVRSKKRIKGSAALSPLVSCRLLLGLASGIFGRASRVPANRRVRPTHQRRVACDPWQRQSNHSGCPPPTRETATPTGLLPQAIYSTVMHCTV